MHRERPAQRLSPPVKDAAYDMARMDCKRQRLLPQAHACEGANAPSIAASTCGAVRGNFVDDLHICPPQLDDRVSLHAWCRV